MEINITNISFKKNSCSLTYEREGKEEVYTYSSKSCNNKQFLKMNALKELRDMLRK